MNEYKTLMRSEVYDLLETMKEQVSAETILDDIVQWFSSDQIGECLQDLCETEYEIPNPYSEDDEDE